MRDFFQLSSDAPSVPPCLAISQSGGARAPLVTNGFGATDCLSGLTFSPRVRQAFTVRKQTTSILLTTSHCSLYSMLEIFGFRKRRPHSLGQISNEPKLSFVYAFDSLQLRYKSRSITRSQRSRCPHQQYITMPNGCRHVDFVTLTFVLNF